MTNLCNPFTLLLQWVDNHGGHIVFCKNHQEFVQVMKDREATFHPAPFSNNDLGIDVSNRTLYTGYKFQLGELIHELAHIFADDGPFGDREEDAFLGWEMAMARYLGCWNLWLDCQKGYNIRFKIGDRVVDDLFDLQLDELEGFEQAMLERSYRLGLIAGNHFPLARR